MFIASNHSKTMGQYHWKKTNISHLASVLLCIFIVCVFAFCIVQMHVLRIKWSYILIHLIWFHFVFHLHCVNQIFNMRQLILVVQCLCDFIVTDARLHQSFTTAFLLTILHSRQIQRSQKVSETTQISSLARNLIVNECKCYLQNELELFQFLMGSARLISISILPEILWQRNQVF